LRKQLPKDDDEDAPDPVDDPEGYEDYVERRVEGKIYVKRMETSRDAMLEHKEYGADYAEMEKLFVYLANTEDSNLAQKMNESSDPALFAYQTAKKYQEQIRKDAIGDKDGDDDGDGKQAEDDDSSEPSKADKRNKSATDVPDLTKSTAEGSNSKEAEKDDDPEDMNEMFSDQEY